MNKMIKKGKYILLVAVIIVLCFAALSIVRYDNVGEVNQENCLQVQIGDSASSVVDLMGKPDKVSQHFNKRINKDLTVFSYQTPLLPSSNIDVFIDMETDLVINKTCNEP